MPGKRSCVNPKKTNRKKIVVPPQTDDSNALPRDPNRAPAEQSLTADRQLNDELHSRREGMGPSALGENQPGDSILEHLREQDNHINRLSNTVDELRKTMGEMSETLTKLRDEGQQHRPSTTEPSGDKFDLVASALREIRSKDDMVERLKLKNDVLTLKIRYLEEKYPEDTAGGLSNNFDDYFEERVDRPQPGSVKVPLKGCDDRVQSNPTPSDPNERERRQCPEVQIPVPARQNRQAKRRSTSNAEAGTTAAETEQPPVKPPAKKQRRSSTKARAPKNSDINQQDSIERGRQSATTNAAPTTATAEPQIATEPVENNASHPALPLRHIPSSPSTSNLSTASTAKEADNPDSTTAPTTQQRRRSARSATRLSRRPSVSPSPEESQRVIPASDETVAEDRSASDPSPKDLQDEQERIRKEQIAARDKLVELAMRREEALDMAENMGHGI